MNDILRKEAMTLAVGVAISIVTPVVSHLTQKAIDAHATRKAGPRKTWRGGAFKPTDSEEEVIIPILID